MAVLIDTSVIVDYERGRGDLTRWIERREDDAFFLSVVTASELLHGVHRATDRVMRTRRSAFVEAILSEFPILPVDILTARTHAQLWAEMASRGDAIGAHDLLLAATCVGRGLTLVTGNEREFGRVPGLEMEIWSD